MVLPVAYGVFDGDIRCFCQSSFIFHAETLYLSMDAARGCGDCPPCPGFKGRGTCPTEEVLSASCLLHDGTGIQSSHLFILRVNQNAPMEDEGREELFMKHLFTMLLTLVAVTASAQDFEVDDICYNILSEDDRTVEVTESPYGYMDNVVIPAEVTYDGSTYSVTTIGDVVFYDCDDLTSVSMPSVTTIGVGAFSTCDALTSVSMPVVTTIGDDAFLSCRNLTSVDIPASCTSIAGNPFQGCKSLEEIVVDENNPNYSSADGVLYDKDKTTLIGWPTAEGEIDIMPSVTTIGNGAFIYCSALTSVSMPSVTTIGDGAFYGCSALTSVSMPSVTTIGNYAFMYCNALTSVSMPSVTTIGEEAFIYCFALTSVEMPSVTTIGDYAFYYCNALTSLDIPASVTTIGYYAFSVCSSLTSVYCHWDEPLECDPGFTDEALINATLYVPVGTIDAYGKVDPWRNFWNIEERDYSGGLSVKVIDGAITVECGDGTASAPVVEVYSAGGQCVWRGTDSSIGGLPRGVYVVKVDGTVQKVAL